MTNAPGRLANPICPVCGGTRPMKSPLLCRTDWLLVPPHIQQQAMRAARTDRSSLAVGNVAAETIAAAVKGRMARAA